MKIEFDVKMTTAKMYDYMLYHTFRSFSGIMGEVVGIMLIACYFATQTWLYLVGGIIVVLYLPVALFMNSKKQVTLNPVFKEPLHYTLDEGGITVTACIKDEEGNPATDSQKWEDLYKACSSSKSIIVYTNKMNACIFPKADLGNKLQDVIQMISTHMDPKRVKIRTMS